MRLEGVVFDFDGVIIDTEYARFNAMQQIFLSFGQTLPMELWIKNIGNPSYVFNPFNLLKELIGYEPDYDNLKKLHKTIEIEIVDSLPLLPGVLDRIKEIHALKARIAIASSSSREWVESHLKKRGLINYFDALVCRNDTTQHKPDPAPYMCAIEKIKCNVNGVIAVEDSPPGIIAAKSAGLFCLGVGCSLTKKMDLTKADKVLQYLEQITFAELAETRKFSTIDSFDKKKIQFHR